MKKLKTGIGDFGPFSSIVKLSTQFMCDGVSYQFSVVGENATIEDWIAEAND